jgi:sulfur relay (sulfurtransferase) DsrF/TusC family protein
MKAPRSLEASFLRTQAPQLHADVTDLIDKRGVPVFVIEEDLAARGIDRGELISGVQLLSSALLPKRMADYDLVSHW